MPDLLHLLFGVAFLFSSYQRLKETQTIPVPDSPRIKQLEDWYVEISKLIPEIPPLNEYDGVIDIGGNVGVFTDAVLTKCPTCQVAVFECVPEYAAFIRSHLHVDENVQVYDFGLSNVNEKNELLMGKINLGSNTLEIDKGSDKMYKINAEFKRLDDLDRDLLPQNIRLIKIDTEGSEWKVIQGAKKFLKSLPDPKPILLIEIITWGEHWKEDLEAFEWLFNNGWKRTMIKNSGTYNQLFYPD